MSDGMAMGPHGVDPLAAAQDELGRRREAAEGSREYQLLDQLEDVADYLRRVALPTASEHYRAEKAGALLSAAVRTNFAAFRDYAAWPEPDSDADRALRAASQVLADLVGPVRMVMWHAARGQPLQHTDADRVSEAASEVSAWAADVAARAVPDEPDGEDF